MASAQYTLYIPAGTFVANAAFKHLEETVRVEAAHVVTGHPSDTLNVVAEDTPEMDSRMKQLGTHAAQAAKAPYVTVVKQGAKAPQTWQMENPSYQAPSVHQELAPVATSIGTAP